MTGLCAPCDAQTTVTYRGPLVHLCPFVDEIDNGAVTITWTTAGSTLELHALTAWLDSFAADRVTHEALTEDIGDHLSGLPGITGVAVETRWSTAGAEVVVRALPREPVHAGGA